MNDYKTYKKIVYENYITSEKWRRKRLQRLKLDNYRCNKCGCKDITQLHVHHKTYKNLGNENVEKDLITLCQKCHTKLHQRRNKQKRKKDKKAIPDNYRKIITMSILDAPKSVQEELWKELEYIKRFSYKKHYN